MKLKSFVGVFPGAAVKEKVGVNGVRSLEVDSDLPGRVVVVSRFDATDGSLKKLNVNLHNSMWYEITEDDGLTIDVTPLILNG